MRRQDFFQGSDQKHNASVLICFLTRAVVRVSIFKQESYPGMDVSEQDEQIHSDASPIRRVVDVALPKVPRKILLLEEIPKGATGKLQRIGMAQKLGLA